MTETRDHRRFVITVLGIAGSATAAAVALLGVVMVLLLLGGKQLADQQACDPESAELTDPAGVSATGRASIPTHLIPLYVAASTRYALGSDGWLWLAAIHKVETDFSRNTATSSAGANGPMQFMPDTWRAYGVDADRDGHADIHSEPDAIFGAANYLHASGAPADWHRAVFAYNHAEWYYQRVLGFQTSYRGTEADAPPETTPASDTAFASLTATPSLDEPRPGDAEQIARARRGRIAYALADEHAQILASFHGQQTFPSASLTKAMLLTAQLRQLRRRNLPPNVAQQLAAMITASDNAAANVVWERVGARGIRGVERAAGMLDFGLRTDDPNYRLGNSRVTAEDQARLFARIDRLLPPAHRAYGLRLLSGIIPVQRWGIWEAGLTGPILGKGGWRPEPSGYVVHQAAQVRIGGQTRGLAVLTQGPGESYGHDTIRLIAAALNTAAPAGVMPAPGSGCAAGQATPGTEIASTPGGRARLTAQGMAVAPQEAPPQIKAILAAGNEILDRPYVYGGGHGTSLTRTVPGYDCSSSISYILFHAALFPGPLAWVSGAFASTYGEPGIGRWVTLRANAGHIYMYVAGLRWDTHRWGAADRGVAGVGWHTAQRPDTGFTARHPTGL